MGTFLGVLVFLGAPRGFLGAYLVFLGGFWEPLVLMGRFWGRWRLLMVPEGSTGLVGIV